jgi:hypothetical protein
VVADARDEERAARVEVAGVEALPRLRTQREQLGARVDVAPALADHLAHLVGVDLLQLHQLLVALGLLELVQAFALQVLDQLDFEHLLVAERPHARRDVREAGRLGGDPAALAGDELVLGEAAQRGERPHHHRLQHADRLDRVGELRERVLREARAAHLLDVRLARRDRGEGDEIGEGGDSGHLGLGGCVHEVSLCRCSAGRGARRSPRSAPR